jgi:hypothetical protein
MKKDTIMKTTITIMFAFSLLVLSGCGPKERPLTQAEIKEAAEFFGGNINFTATQTEYSHNPTKGWNDPTNTTDIAFSEGKRREAVIASFDGSVVFVTITRPGRNLVYYVWTKDNFFVEEVLRSPKAVATPIPNPIKGKSDIGEETVDGHPCIKCKVIIQEGGSATEWTTWEATDLNRFPIRVEYPAGGKIRKFEYTNIKLEKPDPSLFELPKGCRKVKIKPGTQMVKPTS